jgi:hypothetical protein
MDWDTADKLEHFASRTIFNSLSNQEISLKTRWKTLKPYWESIRHGSYAHAAILTAKMAYGFDGINEKTYQPLPEAIGAENRPGIYQRIFDQCGIKAVMTQCGTTDVPPPLIPIMPGRQISQIRKHEDIEMLANEIK